jgi:type II protein arginine methyltransferase
VSETLIDDALLTQPARLIALGRAMMTSGRGDKAVALVEAALARNPADPLLRRAAEAILTHKVPDFHRNMLADARRNEAYRRAIEGADLDGKSVLDIGAGSGLLSMLAARAGAARVYACEANEALAATARAIIAANGLGDRIEIIARHSSALDADRDLGGGVDLIISEIFSYDLIGEGALPSLSHAMAAFARPGARILPAVASVRVGLAHYGGRGAAPVTTVEGFDVSLFGCHGARAYKVAPDHPKLALRGVPRDLFRFDFQALREFPGARICVEAEASGGPVNGIAQWIRLELDAQTTYENAPGEGASHWAVSFHPFDKEIDPPVGTVIAIHGWHDERMLLLSPDLGY